MKELNSMGFPAPAMPKRRYVQPRVSFALMKSNEELVKEMEVSLRTMEQSINGMEATLNKVYAKSGSTIAINVDSGFDRDFEPTLPQPISAQIFQNFKFSGETMEFGPHNVFYNCTFNQCPLTFGVGNLFENCTGIQPKTHEPKPSKSVQFGDPDTEIRKKSILKFVDNSGLSMSQSADNAHSNFSSRYGSILCQRDNIPSLYYMFV